MTGDLNWRGLFAGNPAEVTIVRTSEGRTIGTDRYGMWDLSLVCAAQKIDVPAPGRYRAMTKGLRTINDAKAPPADRLGDLFDRYTAGIKPDPEDRLALSEWADSRHRPIIHTRTADVRRIGIEYDAIPRIGTGSYWVACADWEHTNAAVNWGMYEQAPFGVVQLVGNAGYSSEWNLDPHMAFALAAECEDVSYATAANRYAAARPTDTRTTTQEADHAE